MRLDQVVTQMKTGEQFIHLQKQIGKVFPFTGAALDAFSRTLEKADSYVWFEVGEAEEWKEQIIKSKQILKASPMSRLPYPHTVFSMSCKHYKLTGEDEIVDGLFFCFCEEKDETSFLMRIFVHSKEYAVVLPLGEIIDIEVEKLEDIDSPGDFFWMMKDEVFDKLEFHCGVVVLYVLEILQCNNVYVHKEEVPEKLKKKRLKKGKSVGYAKHTLRIKNQGQEVSTAALGGTHNSPRLHMRRGHIRRLQSGKTTWVTQCMVGSAHGVVEKDYALRG